MRTKRVAKSETGSAEEYSAVSCGWLALRSNRPLRFVQPASLGTPPNKKGYLDENFSFRIALLEKPRSFSGARRAPDAVTSFPSGTVRARALRNDFRRSAVFLRKKRKYVHLAGPQ